MPVIAVTFAPNVERSFTAIEPTPPVAPLTIAFLSSMLSRSKKASTHKPAVKPAVPSIMDSFESKDFGFKTAHFSGTRMNSENPP